MSVQKPAFDDIYAIFHRKIRRYLARRVGETEAEDLTQAVFIKVSQALPDFRRESSLATWIYRIAANAVADKVRTPSFRDTRREDPADGLTSATTEAPNLWTGEIIPAIDQNLIRQEMSECVRGIVEKLPEQSRAVIKLCEFKGLKNGEIAELLGTSLETVKIRLHRARVRLKEDLDTQCHLYRDERNELVCDPKHCRQK